MNAQTCMIAPACRRDGLQDSSEPGDGQFEAFRRILEQYLLPSAPDQVNIDCKLSKRLASFGTRYELACSTVVLLCMHVWDSRVHQAEHARAEKPGRVNPEQ